MMNSKIDRLFEPDCPYKRIFISGKATRGGRPAFNFEMWKTEYLRRIRA